MKEVVTPSIAFTKVGLTNQRFNTQAQENAALNQVRLLEVERLLFGFRGLSY